MRRVVVLALLVLAAAAPAVASVGPRDSDDGTLSIRHARGMVAFNPIRGVVIGRFDRGRILIKDPYPDDGNGASVWGCEHRRDLSDETPNPNDVFLACSGTDVRFRLVGGYYRAKIVGAGISLSVVGHGVATLDGRGDDTGAPDGVYSINDQPYRSLPDYAEDFTIAAPPGG